MSSQFSELFSKLIEDLYRKNISYKKTLKQMALGVYTDERLNSDPELCELIDKIVDRLDRFPNLHKKYKKYNKLVKQIHPENVATDERLNSPDMLAVRAILEYKQKRRDEYAELRAELKNVLTIHGISYKKMMKRINANTYYDNPIDDDYITLLVEDIIHHNNTEEKNADGVLDQLNYLLVSHGKSLQLSKTKAKQELRNTNIYIFDLLDEKYEPYNTYEDLKEQIEYRPFPLSLAKISKAHHLLKELIYDDDAEYEE
jgi:hypothetical protein